MASANKLGSPSSKLSFCPSTRGKDTTLSLRGVVVEMGKERIGRDEDIDPSRAYLNEYISPYGYTTGAELVAHAKRTMDRISKESVAHGGRKVRKDAIPLCATILKPPYEFMHKLSFEEQQRFLHEALEEALKVIGKERLVMAAIHNDEITPHVHIAWEPVIKEEGKPDRLCAKELHGKKFFGNLNREITPALKKRGWELTKSFDWMSATKEQQEERKRLIESGEIVSGLDSIRYKENKIQEWEREKELLLKENAGLKQKMATKTKELAEKDEALSQAEHRVTKAEKRAKDAEERAAEAEALAKEKESQLAALQIQSGGLERRVAAQKKTQKELQTAIDKKGEELEEMELRPELVETLRDENRQANQDAAKAEKLSEEYREKYVSANQKYNNLAYNLGLADSDPASKIEAYEAACSLVQDTEAFKKGKKEYVRKWRPAEQEVAHKKEQERKQNIDK